MHTSLKTVLTASALLNLAIVATAAPNATGYPDSYSQRLITYSVELNKTEILSLTNPIAAIAIGNSRIADVSIHSDRTLFIIGREFGETNIIAMDKDDNIVIQANIQVTNSLPVHGVRLFNGTSDSRRTYSCTPNCLPAPVLGDSTDFINSYTIETGGIRNVVASSSINSATPLLSQNSSLDSFNQAPRN